MNCIPITHGRQERRASRVVAAAYNSFATGLIYKWILMLNLIGVYNRRENSEVFAARP
jgi:hypothetical protein